jgi:hypothetical protein
MCFLLRAPSVLIITKSVEGALFSKVAKFLSSQVYQQKRPEIYVISAFSFVQDLKQSDNDDHVHAPLKLRIVFNLAQIDLVKLQLMNRWFIFSFSLLHKRH